MPAVPDFTNGQWQKQHTKAQLTVSILDGKGDRMPAFAGAIDDKLLNDLVTYIRTFGPAATEEAAGPATDFERRFRELEEEFRELQRQLRTISTRQSRP
jgi:hypothetical protein